MRRSPLLHCWAMCSLKHWGAVGHSLPFTRCELNCGPCALPGLQLKTSTTFPLCAASFQKTTSLRHIWTPRREAFFHLPFCPQAFCKDVRTNLGSSVHRRKGRALKTAASGGCRYPDQGERRSIICHCLLYPPSLPKKVERGEGGGEKKGKRRIKSMADATSHHRGQRLWVTVRFKKRFLNKDGDWTTVELQLTCPLYLRVCVCASLQELRGKKDPT